MTILGGGVEFTNDDDLWVARPPIDEFFALIYDPRRWVHDHVKIVQKKVARQATVLCNYTISYEATDTEVGGDPSVFTVQGIDETNVLTIRMPKSGASYYIYTRLLTDDFGDLPNDCNPDKPDDCPETWSAYLAQLVVQKSIDRPNTGPATIQEAAAKLFHHNRIHLTVCEKSKAYAHMPLFEKGLKRLKGLVDVRDDSGQMALLKRVLNDKYLYDRLAVALYHLFAAAWPAVVEDSFNCGELDKVKDLHFKRWNRHTGIWDNDLPYDDIDLTKLPFRCAQTRPPMTITGRSPSCPPEPPRESGLREFDEIDEVTCEVLVAEYNSGDTSVTWSDAFSKQYGGG